MYLQKWNPGEMTLKMILAIYVHLIQVQPLFLYSLLQSDVEGEFQGAVNAREAGTPRRLLITERCPWPNTSAISIKHVSALGTEIFPQCHILKAEKSHPLLSLLLKILNHSKIPF